MPSALVANGEPTSQATVATVEAFQRADGVLTSPVIRRRGGRWYDAHEYQPTRYDPFEIVDTHLVAPGTVRDTYGPTVPELAENYPVDEQGNPYSPWIVTHRLCWIDIGQDDDYEIHCAWEFDVDVGGIPQLSPVIAIDLDAEEDDETGLLPVWDVSIFDGITYWQVVPRTPDLPSTFDPSYYYYQPDTFSLVDYPAVGRHWWTIRAEGGQLTSWLDGVQRASFARPAWTNGRTKVGVHFVGAHCDPDEVYPPGLPTAIAYRVGTPGEFPVPLPGCPHWQVTTW